MNDLALVEMECLAVTKGGEPVVCWWEGEDSWWAGHRSAEKITSPSASLETEAQAEPWAHGWLAGTHPATGDARFCVVHGAVQ